MFDEDDDNRVVHQKTAASTEPIIMPTGYCMTVKIVSLIPSDSMTCPKFHLFTLNKSNTALRISDRDASTCELKEFYRTISPMTTRAQPAGILGIQKIRIGGQIPTDPKDPKDSLELLGRWSGRVRGFVRDSITLPRVFVHNGATNTYTEACYGIPRNTVYVPRAFMVGSVFTDRSYTYFVPTDDSTLAPHPRSLGKVDWLKMLQAYVMEKVKENPRESEINYCHYLHDGCWPMYGNITESVQLKRLVVIPFNHSMQQSLSVVITAYPSESDNNLLLLLIMDDCRLFFKDVRDLQRFDAELKKHAVYESFQGDTVRNWHCLPDCNWLGALLLSMDRNSYSYVPTTTHYYPQQSDFCPLNLELENFDFTASLLHHYFTADRVDVWLTDRYCLECSCVIFDEIPFTLNCRVHIILTANDPELLLDFFTREFFFRVFDNCAYYLYSENNPCHKFNGNAYRPDQLRFEAEKPFLMPPSRNRTFVDSARELLSATTPFSFVEMDGILHQLGRKNEEYIRSVIVEFGRQARIGDGETWRWEQIMAKLLTVSPPHHQLVKPCRSTFVQRCQLVHPSSRETLDLPLAPSWFFVHSFVVFTFETRDPYGPCLFMDATDVFRGCQSYRRADNTLAHNRFVPHVGFESHAVYNRDDELFLGRFIDDRGWPVAGVRLPIFYSSDVLNFVSYVTLGGEAMIPTCLTRCRLTLQLLDEVLRSKHFLCRDINRKRDLTLLHLCDEFLFGVWGSNRGPTIDGCNSLFVYVLQSLDRDCVDFLFLKLYDPEYCPEAVDFSNISVAKLLVILQFLWLKRGSGGFLDKVCHNMVVSRIPLLIRTWVRNVSSFISLPEENNYHELEEKLVYFLSHVFALRASLRNSALITTRVIQNWLLQSEASPSLCAIFNRLGFMSRDHHSSVTYANTLNLFIATCLQQEVNSRIQLISMLRGAAQHLRAKVIFDLESGTTQKMNRALLGLEPFRKKKKLS